MSGRLTAILEEGRDRVHPYISNILVYYALAHSALQRKIGFTDPEGGPSLRLGCVAAKAEIILPLTGYADAAHEGNMPAVIEIERLPKQPEVEGIRAHGLKDLSRDVVAALFSLYAESATDWIKLNHSTDIHNWPPIANFARVVRNAIVHGGRINIKSETAPVVAWHGTTFSYRDAGTTILNTGIMSMGDLIVLMIDLDHELDELGAPLKLD